MSDSDSDTIYLIQYIYILNNIGSSISSITVFIKIYEDTAHCKTNLIIY